MAFIDSWGATHVPLEKVNRCLSTYIKVPLDSYDEPSGSQDLRETEAEVPISEEDKAQAARS